MIEAESLTRARNTVLHLQDTDPNYKDHPAVITTPRWWLEQIAKHILGEHPGHWANDEPVEIAELHGMKVVVDDNVPEPLAIDHAGVGYPLLPTWARVRIQEQERAKVRDAATDTPPKEG